MRILYFAIAAAITIGLIYVFNTPLAVNGGKTPRLGYFLSPQQGFWQTAEKDAPFNETIHLPELKGKASVHFDERLVPHIYADQTNDAYFIQGYLHARYRLWQMEFQVMAAGGRLSEVMGDSSNGTNFLNIDKFFRRLGMVWAAEKTAEAISENPGLKAACDAYIAGANSWIAQLTPATYPLEYKLLDYAPEKWTLLKTCLLLKYMSFDLAGYEEDFERTNARSVLTKLQYDMLFPFSQDSLQPIVPKEYGYPGLKNNSIIPPGADSAYYSFIKPAAPAGIKPNKRNGSNNWAVAGSKTQSGRPILCNDPHLGLNLPALWYEMQVQTPDYNAYGVGFPGSPCVIIGFNDQCAWGFTNAERDVRDYYEITFKDTSRNEYLFKGEWLPTAWREEKIAIKGKADHIESVPYTIFGPVMYDAVYPDKMNSGKNYACRWKAHDKSNELLTFYKLNYAKSYTDYKDAISTYACPSQNMIFASRTGDIAICEQGEFPAKWWRQGEFLMPGTDSSYAWQYYIPDTMNIIMQNPSRGFVSSANQYPYAPENYPYYLNGTYSNFRGHLINRILNSSSNITVENMQQLQTSNYNLMAEKALPIFLRYMHTEDLTANEKSFLDKVTGWNKINEAASEGASVFYIWMQEVMKATYNDELDNTKMPMPWPEETTLISGIADSTYLFADNIKTPNREYSGHVILAAFKTTVSLLKDASGNNGLGWGSFKDGRVSHLLKIPALSRLHINTGGGNDIINAFYNTHGPSWRMVVELTDQVNAYGIYPGGQSGNPGSRFYDDAINTWADYKYYKLELMSAEQAKQRSVKTGSFEFINN